MVHLQDVPDREWTWAQSGQTLERPWQKKCPRWGIHKLFFNHPQSPISGTSTKAVKQLRTLFAAWAGGMAGAADVSTAVAGAESAAFWDGNMVAVAKVVMTNGWLRVYYGLKMVHENRIKSYSISMVIFIANCQLLHDDFPSQSLYSQRVPRGCSIAGISLGMDSIFLLLVFWRFLEGTRQSWNFGLMDSWTDSDTGCFWNSSIQCRGCPSLTSSNQQAANISAPV